MSALSPTPASGHRKRGPKSILGENPRDRIHDVALACFEQQGIAATSMDDVAGNLGVSRPTLYYYFSSKDELVLEVVARQGGAILRDLPHRLTATGLERIAEAAYLGLIASLDNPYARLTVEAGATSFTGAAMESPRMWELQRAFWLPLLEYAQGNSDLRGDRSLDEIMKLIVFTQFSLATAGIAFGMTREQMREIITTYLIPALRG
ncbi:MULTISPECIES: TetR/AcrR family transcriptional regulator [Mycobacterium]|nr:MULTISPECIES: TetR/AcrR family transcriptional regulator [Mycobacterium]